MNNENKFFAKVSLKNEQRMWVKHSSAGIAVQNETLRQRRKGI
jgi:hypothetical protein